MKKLMFLFLFLLHFVSFAVADETRRHKWSSNIPGLLMLGDVNVSYESDLWSSVHATLVSSLHFVTDEVIKDKTFDSRLSLGIRSYVYPEKPYRMMGYFVELKVGMNQIQSRHIPSLEFWFGHSRPINEWLFLDSKLGASRMFDIQENSGKVLPAASFGFGVIL